MKKKSHSFLGMARIPASISFGGRELQLLGEVPAANNAPVRPVTARLAGTHLFGPGPMEDNRLHEITDAGETAWHFGIFYATEEDEVRRCELANDTDLWWLLQVVGPVRGLAEVTPNGQCINHAGFAIPYLGRNYARAFQRALKLGFLRPTRGR